MDDSTAPPASSIAEDGTAGLDRRLADAVERLGHALRAIAQQHARAQGLTPLQEQALLALGRQPEQRRGVAGLAAEFDVTAPTMSDAVAALIRKGLVVGTVGADARRRVLDLTDEGLAVATRASGWDVHLLAALRAIDQDRKAECLDLLLEVIGVFAVRGVLGAARACTTCRFFRRGPQPSDDHRCELLGVPLPKTELRTDCPEHRSIPAG